MTEIAGKMRNETIELMNELLIEELGAINVYSYLRYHAYRGASTLQAIEYRHRETADALQDRIESMGGVPAIYKEGIPHWDYFRRQEPEIDESVALPKLREAELQSIEKCREALKDRVIDEDLERFIERTLYRRKWQNVHDLDELIIRIAA